VGPHLPTQHQIQKNIGNQADEEGNNISIQQHQTPKILKTSFKRQLKYLNFNSFQKQYRLVFKEFDYHFMTDISCYITDKL